MGRPKGSKNKPKVECTPPPPREEPTPPSDKAEVFEVQIKVLREKGTYFDGLYAVGYDPQGKPYIAKLGWCDKVPPTKELRKKLGVG